MILTCERCSNNVKGIQYSEGEFGIVEKHYNCKCCGLNRHWAYEHYMPGDSDFAKIEVSKEDVIEHMNENNVFKTKQLSILLRKSKMIEYIEAKMFKEDF